VATNACLTLAAVLLYAWVASVTGQIDANSGRGYDGVAYARMLEVGWSEGTANTALRPLIVWLNQPVFGVTGDAVEAFRLMNYAYAGLLCLALCLLFDEYSDDAAVKVLLVANVMLSIPTLKYAAYYPVLIDIGAAAVLTFAMWLIVSGRRIPAAIACVAAVLSREFAVAVIAFGVVRDLRHHVPVPKIAVTYGPAAVVFIVWRSVVAEYVHNDAIVSIGRLLSNAALWLDPGFVAFFLYFAVTLFGGVTMFVWAKLPIGIRHMRHEPEWAVFAAAVSAPALLGSADIWRYLGYLLPVVAVLFAICARDLQISRRWMTGLLICAATVVTQRPSQTLDLTAYFRDWFPYYVYRGGVPAEAMHPEIWPLWAWRFMIAAVFFYLVAALPALTTGRQR
jgi:hypothetical protein